MTSRSLRYRCLLTDTLPYEVPVIFSNSLLHASLSAPPSDSKVANALDQLRKRHKPYSQPYSYDIAKGVGRKTTLGVIHPAWQISIAEFYENHSASMLTYCADDRFSLRRPALVALPFIESASEDTDGRLKLGVAQLASDAEEPDVSHLTTYFAYRKYNLLGKFAESREHQRLEMRFNYRRSLDISKCFYNIYTHSVTWAVKGKSYAKQNANLYTFEGELDSIFQKINYNETNGIVVGPEFSRIFAEIILQRVDRDLVDALNGAGLEVTKDYDIRRYVDDYYIFSNSIEVLDLAENALASALEKFKLYLNPSKRETYSRPFVSDISLARYEIGSLVRELRRALREVDDTTDPAAIRATLRGVRSLLGDVRFAIRTHKVLFENVSGWLLGRYLISIRAMIRRCSESPSLQSFLAEGIRSLVDASIYICSVDTRVRTSYSLCQLLEVIYESKDIFSDHQFDEIEHSINDGISGILRTLWSQKSVRDRDAVELYNLLIAGANFMGSDFTRQTLISEILESSADFDLKYFRYISLKFCLLKDMARHGHIIEKLNNKVLDHLKTSADWRSNSEDYMLLCDFLSAPDVETGVKRALFADLVGLNPSKATLEALVPHVGFVDWTGLSVKHLLKRKTLRPVYAWS